ncbi:MAG: hypothetical protein OEM04_11585, partial [Flavobacteriaceae bacterium]|nr:hypothetical protein [Flavobacteriaceae bacterium]
MQKNVLVQAYQIKNVKFSNLPDNALKNINIDQIPKKIDGHFEIHKARNKSIAKLSLNPLINSNGQIKKIESFTLEYSLGAQKSNVNNKIIPTPVYASNSVLSNGTWFKFAIDTTGVFKIDKKLLEQIGVSTANL